MTLFATRNVNRIWAGYSIRNSLPIDGPILVAELVRFRAIGRALVGQPPVPPVWTELTVHS